jgi:exosome complex component RRP4
MSGQGTYEEGDQIYSSLAGITQTTGSLISVKPAKKKYTPDVGDIVIGRIISVENS